MSAITLPPRTDGSPSPGFPSTRQLILVGGSGAGKTRFMRWLVNAFGDRAFVLSALGAVADIGDDSSISALYSSHIWGNLKSVEHATELDRLAALLFQDEFQYLLSAKSAHLLDGQEMELKPTRLDRVVEIWQEIFPDNRIMREQGRLLFSTPGGSNLISAFKLSSGEKTVLYYVAAALYAPENGVIFIDDPSIFIHPALLHPLWNAVEGLRPDCRFVYNTADTDFLNSRTEGTCVWIRSHDAEKMAWDYEILQPDTLPDELVTGLVGTRRPILFIEGDATHSIDAKLYPLVFPTHTVRPLGSCNKVIEATRSFSDIRGMHQLDSYGIVDRDRRTPQEVDYLRRKRIMVPEVAEVENLFMLEQVIRIMARRRGRDPQRVADKVRRSVLKMFASRFREQVLQHVRHRMKRQLECRADARVKSIGELERHLRSLPDIINVREQYNQLTAEFNSLLDREDYAGILRVFNHKPMLPESQLPALLGYPTKEAYITGVLETLKAHDTDAKALRGAIRAAFNQPAAPGREAENGADGSRASATHSPRGRRPGRHKSQGGRGE